MTVRTISKELSANDTGESGGHQAGILVPKTPAILGFFPALEKGVKNPRATLKFNDGEDRVWSFSFIYYNNRFFGGTRNEYRLTGMTEFFRSNSLTAGDELHFTAGLDGKNTISYSRRKPGLPGGPVILTGKWKVINI